LAKASKKDLPAEMRAPLKASEAEIVAAEERAEGFEEKAASKNL
jgi:hypothetical protein